MFSIFSMCSAFTASRKLFCLLVGLIAMQSNSSNAQFVYGVAGSPTPVPSFATGLPVFDYPRPVLTIGFDDAVQWASEKKTDAEQQAKAAREKANAKHEAQRREAEKREAEKQRVEAEKKETAKKEAAKKEQAAKNEAAMKQEKENEAPKRKNEASELQLREPDNRERVADVWDRDLPTERPRQTEDKGPHQGWAPGAPDAPPQMLRKVIEMRERLIREHGPDHPSIRPLNAALEEFERRQQGPRPEPPRQANQGRGPQERGPQDQGPREQGPRVQGPRGHALMGSVDELMHTVERLDRMIERLANEYHAINEEDGDDENDEDDEDEDEESDSIRKKLQEMVELRLELRQRVKRFQLEMMRLELERATMETELFEQSLEAIHAVTVEEILHR